MEERLAARAGLRFAGVEAGGVHGLAPWRVVWNLTKLMRGFVAALWLGWRARPQVLFVTGGYASIPVALAAWTLRVPILLYLPDIEPGLAVRFIARLATRIAVTTDRSRSFLPQGKVVVTGYPVRPEFFGQDRAKARQGLGLEAELPVLLVYGGSHGARSINRAMMARLEELLWEAQVVHVSGKLDWPWVAEEAENLPPNLRPRYHPYPYLHEGMGEAMAAADLAVCRAGASVLGELPAASLPAILIPYPHAWRYQRVNAEWLVSQGAAVMVEDGQLAESLLPTVRQLLHDPAELERMRRSARALARPEAVERLADHLWALGAREEGQQ